MNKMCREVETSRWHGKSAQADSPPHDASVRSRFSLLQQTFHIRMRFQPHGTRIWIALIFIFIISAITITPTHAHTTPRRITAAAQQGAVTWLGSTEGLWRYENNTLIPVELPFLDAHVTALYHDGSALWVGTYSTIGRYTPTERWQTWQRGEAGLPSAWARGFTTYQGQLIVATYDRGAARWDGQAWQPIANSPLRMIALASDTTALYANTTNGEQYRYDGVEWQKLNEGLPLPPTLPALPTLPLSSATKPPVILIHGLGDSNTLTASNLRFLARWLEADGYPVYYVRFNPTAPLLANTALVANSVVTAQTEHPSQKPILIAHSFGGLLARSYLALNADEVSSLVTLGTPHAGVRLAYDFIVPDLGTNDNPQLRELLPEHTALLEPFWANESLPQLHIAGDLLPRENFFEGFPPHDGIVDTASAVAAPGATRIYPLLHGWTFATMRYGIHSYLSPQTLYFTTVRPFLAALDRTPPTDRALTPLLATPGFTQRPIVVGTLAPNSTQTASVMLDADPATWFLNAEGVEMTLIAPDGKRYVGVDTGVGTTVSHLPYRENVLQPLDLWSTAQAGAWQVELTNTTSDAEAVRLTLIQPQKPALTVTVTTPWVAPNNPVTIEVQALPNQSLIAFMGESQTSFVEASLGLYRATVVAPATPGYYALRVSNGTDERWAVVTVRSTDFQVGTPTTSRTADTFTLNLPVTGNGAIAVGVRILRGEATIAETLQPFAINRAQPLSVALSLPASATDIRVEWQLFDATEALVPITNVTVIE
jgi:pimeloyl-ACP methyl ester carboxylesterase